MKSLITTIFLLFFLQIGWSQYTEVINSKRPGFSDTPYSVGTKVYQVEGGLFYKNVLSRLLDIILFTNKNHIIGEQVGEVYPSTHKKSRDEIDQLIDSLNSRATHITKEFTKRLTVESDLEHKNFNQLKEKLKNLFS